MQGFSIAEKPGNCLLYSWENALAAGNTNEIFKLFNPKSLEEKMRIFGLILSLVISVCFSLVNDVVAQAVDSDQKTSAVIAEIREISKLASSFYVDGEIDKSVVEIDKGLAKYPDSVFLLTSKWNYLAMLGKWKEVMLVGKRLVEVDPTKGGHYISLAIAYEQLGQVKKKQKSLQSALAAFDAHLVDSPDDSSAKANRTLVLASLGREKEAKEILNQMLKKDPKDNAAQFGLELIEKGGLKAIAEDMRQAGKGL